MYTFELSTDQKLKKNIFLVFFGSIFFSFQMTRRSKIGNICTHNSPNIGSCHLDTVLILLGSFWPSIGTKKCPKFVGHHCKIFKKSFFPLSLYIIYHFEAFFKQNTMGLFKNWCWGHILGVWGPLEPPKKAKKSTKLPINMSE